MTIMRIGILVIIVLLSLSPHSANAITLGPKREYSGATLDQYWAGVVSTIAMRFCGEWTQGNKLKQLVKKFEPAKYAFRQWNAGDGYQGNCSEIIDDYLPYYINLFENNVGGNTSNLADMSDRIICTSSITRRKPYSWKSHGAGDYIEEAKRRGYTVHSCAQLLGRDMDVEIEPEGDELVKKLKTVKNLLEQGLITEEEALEKRSKILSEY